MALQDLWPIAGLVIRTPRLELRWPSDDDLVALAELAAEGVHGADEMPFTVPWTRGTPTEVRRRVLQWHWQQRAQWTAGSWAWTPVVVADGEVVGTQSMFADHFAVRRSVGTGSWLGRRFQGRGIGVEMRRAVLHLAFTGLGAAVAETGAFEDNTASLSVTGRLGYRPNGDKLVAVEGRPRRVLLFALDRPSWASSATGDDVELAGVAPCLELFGADVDGGPDSG